VDDLVDTITSGLIDLLEDLINDVDNIVQKIEDADDGDDGNDSSEENSSMSSTSSTSASCTATTTVSNCMVLCVSATSSSSCVSYSTTCSRTSTGCSIEGTTSTVSSISACQDALCNQCFLGLIGSPGTAVPPLTTSSPSLDPGRKKRGIAGHITMDPLEKRVATTTIMFFGDCSLATPYASQLTIPRWPKATPDLLLPDEAGTLNSMLSVIPRYDRATNDGCVFTTTRLDANSFANAPKWQDSWGITRDTNNMLSMDHPCKFFYNLLSNEKTDIH